MVVTYCLSRLRIVHLKKKKWIFNHTCWLMLVVPALERERQEHCQSSRTI